LPGTKAMPFGRWKGNTADRLEVNADSDSA